MGRGSFWWRKNNDFRICLYDLYGGIQGGKMEDRFYYRELECYKRADETLLRKIGKMTILTCHSFLQRP